MKSIWHEKRKEQKRKRLEGTQHTEVAVIGAGMAGVLTAYLLKEAGKKVTVLEAETLAGGQTAGTTAKITSQHGMIYGYLEKNFGREGAALYAQANESAIKEYERIIYEKRIDCNFGRCPAYLYTLEGAGEQERIRKLQTEIEIAAAVGISAEFTTKTELTLPIAGAEVFENQAQFHPLKFIYHLAEELEIYEDSRVVAVKDNCLFTKGGILEAEHIVFTCHYPWLITPGYYFMRMHQERSYVLALQRTKSIKGIYRDMETDGLSFRSYGEYLLMGGSGHRTGKNKEGGNYEALKKKAGELFPEAKVAFQWSAQDCVTLDKIPYIGYYSAQIPNWYVATGYGKWGMTGSMVSAIILRDMILAKENPWEAIYTPQRMNWKVSLPQLWGNMESAIVNLSKRWIPIMGKEKQKPPTCQHMGCQLMWNHEEQSWDCPCHGSRYSEDGKLLCGPSQKALEEIRNEERK